MDYNLYGMNLLHASTVKFRNPVRLLNGRFINYKSIIENDIFSVSDTGILGKRNSEFSQQESNLRPSELVIGRS